MQVFGYRKGSGMSGFVAAFTSASVALLMSALVAAPAVATEKAKLLVLVTNGGLYEMPLQAVMKDYADKYDLDITRSVVTGGGASAQMFGGGTGDIMLGGLEGPVGLVRNKIADVTIIGETLRASPWVLVAKAGAPYHSIKDLKGKRVGITGFGASSDAELRYYLKQNDMDPEKDVQILALGNGPSQLAALQIGNADAVLQGSPYLTRLLNSGEVQIVFDYGKFYWANNVVTARTKALQANPEVYERFMQAYREAFNRIFTDHEYATKLATELWGKSITPDDLQIELKDYTERYWQPDARLEKEHFDLGVNIIFGSDAVHKEGFPTFEQLTQYSPK